MAYKTKSLWRLLPGLAVLFVLPAYSVMMAGEASAAPVVEVTYSKGLTKRLDGIDQMEQMLEERFRKTGTDDPSVTRSTISRFAKVKTAGTRWAGEQLIPDVKNYGLTPLVTALTVDNLARAVPDFDGTIHYEIDRLRVASHPVAYLSGSHSYVMGKITVLAPDGSVMKSEAVSANLVVDPSVDLSYQGEKYAFIETDEEDRVGPTLSYFVKRALETAFPDHKDEIYGPVIIRLSGPNESIIHSRR